MLAPIEESESVHGENTTEQESPEIDLHDNQRAIIIKESQPL
jgi:hypothetical protein